MKAIRLKIYLIFSAVLFCLGAALPITALGSDGGGSASVVIGGGPSGISRGATGVHSIPFGERNAIRNLVDIDKWQSDTMNVVDFAGTSNVYPDDFWANLDFVSRVRKMNPKARKMYIDGMTEIVILCMLEQSYDSNLQRILRILEFAAMMQFLDITEEK